MTRKAAAARGERAVIYARYSSHAQTEQSIEGQLHDGHAYARKQGWPVVAEYIDRAQTGRKDTRPDFQRMIRDAEKRQFTVVIVWKLDRFARNRYDSAFYKARLKKYGVRVVSVMENIGDGPESIIMEGILESMAEYYSANLAENVRRGMQEMVRKGWYPGGPAPLGYEVRDHHLVEDPRMGPVVREMFRRYADGESPSEIVRDLNARGIRSRKGRPLGISHFKNFENPVYVGRYTYSGQVVEGAADALVDEETFRRVCQRRELNRRGPAAFKASERYQLRGKIFCGHCGAPMIGESGRSKSGPMYHYYACAKKKKSHGCRKKNERKDFVEWYVCEQTVAYILDPERLDMIARRVVEAYDKEFDQDGVRELERNVQRIEQEIANVIESLTFMPAKARPQIGERLEALYAEKEDAEAELTKLRLAVGIRLTEDQVMAWLKTFQRGDLMDEDFRQKIIDVFVNSVYLYDDKVVIFYNVRGGSQSCVIDGDDLWEMVEEEGDVGEGEGSDLEADGVPFRSKSEPRYVMVRGMLGIVIWR